MKKSAKAQLLKGRKLLPLLTKAWAKWFKTPLKKRKVLRRKNSSPLGECHDLQKIFQALNVRYFGNAFENLPVYWFGSREFKHRYKIIFGSYHSQRKEIKIHRILDHPEVQEHTVSFVLYHEMLHHVLPPIKRSGKKRSIHHPDFREREKLFSEYVLAQEGIEALLARMWPSRKKKEGNKKATKGQQDAEPIDHLEG